MNPVRFAHFHAGTILTDKTTGATREAKGRLIATIATQELPSGALAVGVSRCSTEDTPVRFRGRMIAQARLNRLLQAATGEGVKPTQTSKFAHEQSELLSFRIRKEDLIEQVIKTRLFRDLCSEEVGARIRALQTLKSLTLE